jgi:L-2-hydroxyglutarate oxidase
LKQQSDIGIVGGGIVGLATAYKLQLNFPHLDIVVLEKEAELAFHQTGRNSGVMHSGLYYKHGSLKAKNCVEGRRALIEFAEQNNVEYDICGKIVVAINKEEEERLEQLKTNGEKNGLNGLSLLTAPTFLLPPYLWPQQSSRKYHTPHYSALQIQ